MRVILSGLVLCTILAGVAPASTLVEPDDPGVVYTGRWDDSNPSEPWSYWIGSSIIVRFEGTSIAAEMAGGAGASPDYVRVIIDGDLAGSTKLAVGTSLSTYLLASGLADTTHTIELVKETDVGRWRFAGFELDDDRAVAAAPARPARRIVFFGDSNLAGYSLESEENESGRDLQGSHFGYAGIASRMLGAEYHNVSRSGATISSLHSRYDRVDYRFGSPAWGFGFAPDLVVVNLGANDVGSSVASIKSDYNSLLDDLRGVYPSAHIMLFNGWGWDYDEPANFIHEVIASRGTRTCRHGCSLGSSSSGTGASTTTEGWPAFWWRTLALSLGGIMSKVMC